MEGLLRIKKSIR